MMTIEFDFETTEQYNKMKKDVEEFANGFEYEFDEEFEAITFKYITYFDHNQTSYEIRNGIRFFDFYDGDFSWVTIEQQK